MFSWNNARHHSYHLCIDKRRDWEHDKLVRFSCVYFREIMFVYLSYITPSCYLFSHGPRHWMFSWFSLNPQLYLGIKPCLPHWHTKHFPSIRANSCAPREEMQKSSYFHLGKIVCIYSCTHKFVQNYKWRFVLQLSTAYIEYALTLIFRYIPHNKIPKLSQMILFILGFCKLLHTCCFMFASSSVTVCSLFFWTCAD